MSAFNSDVCPHGLYNYCAKCSGDVTAASTKVFDEVMSAPTIEKKIVRFAGPRVIGFRVFQIDDDTLKSWGVSTVWSKNDNGPATCRRGKEHPEGEPIPSMNCSCGWYAFKDLDALRADHDLKYQKGVEGAWIGVVIGWGRIAPHDNGFRAERMRLVALMGAAHLGGESVAERYGVPLFRFEYPVGATLDNGFVVGQVLRTVWGPSIVIGNSAKGSSHVKVSVNGYGRSVDVRSVSHVDLMPDVTDGATRMYRGDSFDIAYAKARLALDGFAQQFGAPLDDVYAKYAKPLMDLRTATAEQVKQAFANSIGQSFAGVKPTTIARSMPTPATSKGPQKKLYDSKWRLAKNTDTTGAAMAKFKADWKAGKVTAAWRP